MHNLHNLHITSITCITCFNKVLEWVSELERLGPIDRTPGIPGSDKNDWTTGQKVILVIEHWNLRVLSFRDIMVARELLSKNLFLWKVFWNQSLWNLFTRSNTCLRCAVLSLMLRLLCFSSHPSLCPGRTNWPLPKRYHQGSLRNQPHSLTTLLKCLSVWRMVSKKHNWEVLVS